MRKKRVITDVGIYHIYQQANSRVIIFYDDEDRTQFLRHVAESSRLYGVSVYAYVLMDNHWHLLVKATYLTEFVKRYLLTYVKWYNRKYGKRGNLCNGPFSSSPKSSIQSIVNCICYIINNPVKAGIFDKPFNYRWSSANQYFDDIINCSSQLPVDDSILKIYFSNKTDFCKFIINSQHDIDDFKEGMDLNFPVKHSELSEKLVQLLNNRSLYELSRNEIVIMILYFVNKTNASYVQIATLMHVSYTFVRDVAKGRLASEVKCQIARNHQLRNFANKS